VSRRVSRFFVYGTFKDVRIFRSVTGLAYCMRGERGGKKSVLVADRAMLDGWDTLSPDELYLYAIPRASSRIHGLVIHGVPDSIWPRLDQFEGPRYQRRTVSVAGPNGPLRANAYVCDEQQLLADFGHRYDANLKLELVFSRKLRKMVREIGWPSPVADDPLRARAVEELKASTMEAVVREHFNYRGLPEFVVKDSLAKPLPSFAHLRDDPRARKFMRHYVPLVVRQVLFNQLEELIREDFRYEIDQFELSDRFYEHTISSLAALYVLNQHSLLVHAIVYDILRDLPDDRCDLLDVVAWAIQVCDFIYDDTMAEYCRESIEWIRRHHHPGRMAMGAELELSNVGHRAVAHIDDADQPIDPKFDRFRYFSDFGLDVLTWKLGGHVDDHRAKSQRRGRQGFLEFALGNINIERDLAKPDTRDPWTLSQLICEIARFYSVVKPHSVHITFELPDSSAYPPTGELPFSFIQCLLAIGGDVRRGPDGRVRERRVGDGEILETTDPPSVIFTRAKHSYSFRHDEDLPEGVAPERHSPVTQYKFLRLDPKRDYESIILALKGLTLELNPGPWLTSEQSKRSSAPYDELRAWAERPSPIPDAVIDAFLDTIRAGLHKEADGQPAHSRAYIDMCLTRLRTRLDEHNELTEG